MDKKSINNTEKAKLMAARQKFSQSMTAVEGQVNNIENSFSEVADTVTGRKLWRDHFWLTAAGSVAVGMALSRTTKRSPTKVETINRRLGNIEKLVKQLPQQSPSTASDNSGIKSMIKQKTIGNPAFLTSLVSLGMNLLSSDTEAKNRPQYTESKPDEIWHH